jgi:DNA-binding CsgD family transcriptional regulator
VVVIAAVLLDLFDSWVAAAAVAEFVSTVPLLALTVTLRTSEVDWPTDKPPARAHSTVRSTTPHAQPPPDAPVNLTPTGRASATTMGPDTLGVATLAIVIVYVAGARSRLGDEAFADEWSRGAVWTRRSMIDEALRFTDVVAGPQATAAEPAAAPPTPSLTRRELEVLHLLAEGVSNKEIATQLGMAPKTAMHHTTKIYRKLDVRGRGQAAAWARRAGIV